MEEEIWKDIEGYEGLYQVSSLGRVRNIKRNKVLSPSKRKGYWSVQLCKNGKVKRYDVHRLVALAFLSIPNNADVDKIQVGHKDEQNLIVSGICNNCANNLEWVTPKQNSNTFLHKQRISKSNQGRISPMLNKFHSEETKQKMKENHHNKKKVECEGIIFNTVKECALYYNIPYSTLKNWLNKKRKMRNDFVEKGLKYFDD